MNWYSCPSWLISRMRYRLWPFFGQKFKKMGFSPKMLGSPTCLEFCLDVVGPPGECAHFRNGSFCGPALSFPANRKKTPFETFPDLWHHRRVRRPGLIRNLAYRPNETFFSRTLSFGCGLQVWIGGWLSKVQNDDENAAHVRNGMVHCRSPDRRFARGV